MCAIVVYKDGFVKTISDITYFKYIFESNLRKFVGPCFYFEYEICTYDDSSDIDSVYICLSEVDSIEIFDNSLDSLEDCL